MLKNQREDKTKKKKTKFKTTIVRSLWTMKKIRLFRDSIKLEILKMKVSLRIHGHTKTCRIVVCSPEYGLRTWITSNKGAQSYSFCPYFNHLNLAVSWNLRHFQRNLCLLSSDDFITLYNSFTSLSRVEKLLFLGSLVGVASS